MISCNNCKRINPPESKFCLNCGEALRDYLGELSGPSKKVAPPDTIRTGLIINGRYQITKEVGRGGMGTVYLGIDLNANKRQVAIKILPSSFSKDPEKVKRFEREAKVTAKLKHPNIIPIYEIGIHEKLHFFVMKYIEGKNILQILYDRLRNGLGPFPQTKVHQYLLQACDGLSLAHKSGLIHRDIKPSNFMVENDNIILMDFGIVKDFEAEGLTRTGVVLGTPEFLAPEQARGLGITKATDIYSLGVVSYQMLTGKLPFHGHTAVETMIQHIEKIPEPLHTYVKDIDPKFEQIILKAMEKDPKDRYKDCLQLKSALENLPFAKLDSPTGQVTAPISRTEFQKIAENSKKANASWRNPILIVMGLFFIFTISFLLFYLMVFEKGKSSSKPKNKPTKNLKIEPTKTNPQKSDFKIILKEEK